ncbi:MAG: hypothetical protein A2X86_11940 [Bdellovibrionales bacterium GWA2_49_15]|nr:MAG: hypothetical protein A2X86_11940 [Bdellovibrionales bacterium GWA2_49_15]
MDSWRTISSDGNTVILKRFSGLELKPIGPDELAETDIKVGCAVDVETTGVDRFTDSVIEVGLQVFFFEAESGKIVGKGESLNHLQDPGKPINELITRITGIKNSDLKNQRIDWNAVAKLIDSSHLVVAHNAFFDRSFIDRNTTYSSRPVWGCSLRQIDWVKHGCTSSGLQMLAAFHGFFSKAHRALQDAQMLVHLLDQDKHYVQELYQNAHAPRVIVKLNNTPYESRSLLRESGYRWSPTTKTWSQSVLKEHLKTSLSKLSDVYMGKEPQYETIDIPLSENFKV